MDKANSKQVGGTHYQGAMQPWDFIISNNLGYLEGTAIKYLARWRKKNGVEDLRKAIHFIEKLIETELAKHPTTAVCGSSNLGGGGTKEQQRHVMAQHVVHCDVDEIPWSSNLNTEAVLRPDVEDE